MTGAPDGIVGFDGRVDLAVGLRVVDIGDEVGQIAGKILRDLGAEVVKVEPPGGDPLRHSPPVASFGGEPISTRYLAWNAGKQVVEAAPGDPLWRELMAAADVVVSSWTTGPAPDFDRADAPGAVCVTISPFGETGPRARWRGSDLTCMAGGGNLFATGDPDRRPVRSAEPLAYVHAAAEAVVGAFTALATGLPETVSVSIQEAAVLISLYGPTDVAHHGDRGVRRGSSIGQVSEVWVCADGYVAFGARGGAARVPSWEAIADAIEEDGLDATAVRETDWLSYDFHHAKPEVIAAVVPVVTDFFSRHTMQELFELAMSRHVMLAPVAAPSVVMGYPQFAARGFVRQGHPRPVLAGPFVRVTEPPGTGTQPVSAPWGLGLAGRPAEAAVRSGSDTEPTLPWAGLRIVEFGSGIAGPLISRFFVEHGARCIRVESSTRPDVMRVAGTHPTTPDVPQGEGSAFFANLNQGKESLLLDMAQESARPLARQLIGWADVVVENFRPGTLEKWGIGYADVAGETPGVIYVSSSMWGAGGPHSRYPGYGSQGTALAGYTGLSGWADRPPCGIYPGALTDSLGPVYSATAVGAALWRRARTGRGVNLDLAQIEAAVWTLAPWILDWRLNGQEATRRGNRSAGDAVPHGVFASDGLESWVAVAAWSDEQWRRLCAVAALDDLADLSLSDRQASEEEIEARLERWTTERTQDEAAEALQAVGVDVYPVRDFPGVHTDPQLIERGHYETTSQTVLGKRDGDHCSFRLAALGRPPLQPGPLFGQHTNALGAEVLGLGESEIAELVAQGVLR